MAKCWYQKRVGINCLSIVLVTEDGLSMSIKNLIETTSPSYSDFIYALTDPAGTPTSKKISLLNSIPDVGVWLTRSSAQSVPFDTVTTLNFDTEAYDTHGFFDAVVDNTKLIVPSGLGGIYFYGCRVAFSYFAKLAAHHSLRYLFALILCQHCAQVLVKASFGRVGKVV